MCQLEQGRLIKALERKHTKLNEQKKESDVIRQMVIQHILKLVLIFEYSQLETKGRSNRSRQ